MSANGSDSTALLKEARESLSPDERKILKRILARYELDLVGSLRQMIASVKTSRRQSTVSATVAITPAKGDNVRIDMDPPRVRGAMREKMSFEAHLSDQDQLALGWVEAEDEPEEGESGNSRDGDIGFDEAVEDGAFQH